MLHTNIHQAKTHLSRYIEMVEEGERVTICRSGKPVALLVPYDEPIVERRFGSLKGQIHIHDDFDVMPDWFNEHFS